MSVHRILVPLDGSRASESALRHALAVVGVVADGLLLLRVLRVGDDPEGIESRFQRTEASAYLDQTAERLAQSGVDVTTLVSVGGVADEIVRCANREDVSLVVLTSHGHGAASGFAFGGTALKVLSRIATSVMVVRPLAPGEDGEEAVHYDRVLVPVDGSTPSEWALFPAATIAQRHDAALHVLHLVPEAPRTLDRLPPSPGEEDLVRRLAQLRHDRGARYLRDIEGTLTRDDLRVEGRVLHTSDPATDVTTVVREHAIDLIALDARCATSTRGRVGSVARSLLDASQVPVIVLQDSEGAIGRKATRRWSGTPGSG
jgi:nucleotide-binding universal stress UspA family protein